MSCVTASGVAHTVLAPGVTKGVRTVVSKFTSFGLLHDLGSATAKTRCAYGGSVATRCRYDLWRLYIG